MKELESTVKMNPATLKGSTSENGLLRQLTGIINSNGVSADDNDNGFSMPPTESIPTPAEQVQALRHLPPTPVVTASRKTLPARVFTTGRMKSGKDFILRQFQYAVHGFAEPLYALQEAFFPGTDKQSPGARQFLQKVGQFGRGIISKEYPLSTERAVFEMAIRQLGAGLPAMGVNWDQFGRTDRLWVDALLWRVSQSEDPNIDVAVGVSNVRFENEYTALTDAGWTHFHVMCSPDTWAKRLREGNLTPQSPAVTDLSEQMAIALDADSLKRAKLKPQGPKLRVIWNDPGVRSPSPRFYLPSELTR